MQIYHNANNSYVQDVGTGKLHITSDGTGVSIDKGTSELMATFDTDGAVTLYYDNSAKLATTSTGVDITGVLSSDGLTVENTGGSTLNINTNLVGADSKILLHEGSTASPANGASIRYAGATNEFSIGVGSSVDTKRLSIARDTGDISFYEDTGTTAKFFWDASAESLGIGNSSPSEKLDVTGNISVSGTVDGRDIATNIPSSLGTAGQVLAVNSGATATEWADASGGGGGGITTGKAIAMAMVFG